MYLYKTDVQGFSSASVSKVQIISVFCAYIIDNFFFKFFFFQKLYFKDMKISIADKSNWNKLNWRILRSMREWTSYFYEGVLFSKTQTAIPCYLPVFFFSNKQPYKIIKLEQVGYSKCIALYNNFPYLDNASPFFQIFNIYL